MTASKTQGKFLIYPIPYSKVAACMHPRGIARLVRAASVRYSALALLDLELHAARTDALEIPPFPNKSIGGPCRLLDHQDDDPSSRSVVCTTCTQSLGLPSSGQPACTTITITRVGKSVRLRRCSGESHIVSSSSNHLNCPVQKPINREFHRQWRLCFDYMTTKNPRHRFSVDVSAGWKVSVRARRE